MLISATRHEQAARNFDQLEHDLSALRNIRSLFMNTVCGDLDSTYSTLPCKNERQATRCAHLRSLPEVSPHFWSYSMRQDTAHCSLQVNPRPGYRAAGFRARFAGLVMQRQMLGLAYPFNKALGRCRAQKQPSGSSASEGLRSNVAR